MIITIVSNQDVSAAGRQAIESITRAGKHHGITIKETDLTTLDDLKTWVDTLGDVIIYRGATAINNATQRIAVLNKIKSKKILINEAITHFPKLRWKDWQQEFINQNTSLNTIPTWKFNSLANWQKAISQHTMSFPLIQKPRGGVAGIDVNLLFSPSDLVDHSNLKRYIWQPYIPNQGDYRIIVIGGHVIGTMHRSAIKGRVANNISQGGIGSTIDDPKIASIIENMALEIQRVIPLDVVGIDIIQSQTDKKYYFLELNITPAWSEFETVNNISVGDKLIDLCQHRYQQYLTFLR